MALTNIERTELRTRINTKLRDVEFNSEHRLVLPSNRLDEILFDYDFEGKKFFKYNYEGLCKIDLSNVDFENTIFMDISKVNFTDTNTNLDMTTLCDGICIVKDNHFIPIYGNLRNKSSKNDESGYSRELSNTINGTLDIIDSQLRGNGGRILNKNAGSFYGCDDAPLLPGQGEKPIKKEKTLNKTIQSDAGSFYGCNN